MKEEHKTQLTEADLLRMSLSLDGDVKRLARSWGISAASSDAQPLKKTTLPGGINSENLGPEQTIEPIRRPSRSKSSPSHLLDMGR